MVIRNGRISAPPINIPHNTLAIDPNAPATIFTGTDLGLWISPDVGQNWTQVGYSELPHVTVTDIEINLQSSSVIVATYGRGAYRLSTGSTTTIVPDVVGATQAAAEAAIVEANLVVGTVTMVNDSAADETVIAQIPAVGTELAEGSSVDLTISLGPAPQGTIADQIQDLINTVKALDLPKGLTNALTRKLTNILKKLTDGNSNNDGAAANTLQAFIKQIQAQSGKKIDPADADALTASVTVIINQL